MKPNELFPTSMALLSNAISNTKITSHLQECNSPKESRVGEFVDRREFLHTSGSNVNWGSHLEDHMDMPQKVKKRNAVQSSYPIYRP